MLICAKVMVESAPLPASRRRRAGRIPRVLALILLAASLGLARAAAPAAPLLDGMGPDRGPVASRIPLAQRYFHQGMALTWGFNPAEATRSFAAAAAIDPGCALCYWGLAWASGPNINADMTPDDAARVRDALGRARALAARASPRYRELIEALSARHPAAGDAAAVDEEAYADRMRGLARNYPRDADIATLAAEAQLNLHPYDWWTRDGDAQPWTGEIRRLLSRALALAPAHPGANHYWVHLMESSAHPGEAQASADRLTQLVPGSGHLTHMPAHIHMRTGRYAAAVAANERAIAADRRYIAEVDAQGAYRVGYVAHNRHFLWAAAAMDGRSARPRRGARRLPCGLRTGAERSQHGDPAALLRAAVVRAGPLRRWREILEDTLAARGRRALPARHLALRARYGLRDDGPHSRGPARAGCAGAVCRRSGAAAGAHQERQPSGSAGAHRRAHAAADIAAAEKRMDLAIAKLVEATAVEDALRLRRAASVAGADAACAGCRVACRGESRRRRARLSRGPAALPGERLVA